MTKKRRIFFKSKNNLLVFSQKIRMIKSPVLDKKTEGNLSNPHVTDEMLRKEVLKLALNKSCESDEMNP